MRHTARVRSWFRLVPRDILLLWACALVFYLVASWWGVPHATAADRVQAWGVDDDTPLGPLTQIHQIISPQPDPWLSYPLMQSFVLAGAYAPYFVWLLITGRFTGMSAVYPFGLTDPVATLRVLTLIAHTVSALMASVVVAAAAWTGRLLWDRPTSILYGVLVLFSFPLVYYARVGNVDAMAMAFTMAAVAVFVRITQTGLSRGAAIAVGALAGAALATKESSIGVFLPMPFVILAAWRLSGGRLADAAFWRAALAGALSCAIVFGVGSGLFVDPERFFAHLAYLRGLLDLVASADVGHPFAFPYTASGEIGYLRATAAKLLDGMTMPGLLLSAVGIALAIARRERSRIFLLLPLAYVLYLFISYRLVQVRYLMPAMLLLLGFAASGVVALVRENRRVAVAVGALLGIWLVGQEALVATDYTYQMLRDSRYVAGRWLAERAAAGSVVAYFGPSSTLPPLDASVVTVRATEARGMYWKPRVDDAKVAEILEHWREQRPDFIVTMPDYTSHDRFPHSHSLPPRLYEQLLDGRAGFGTAAQFHTAPLFPWLRQPPLDYPVVNPPIRVFAPTPAGHK